MIELPESHPSELASSSRGCRNWSRFSSTCRSDEYALRKRCVCAPSRPPRSWAIRSGFRGVLSFLPLDKYALLHQPKGLVHEDEGPAYLRFLLELGEGPLDLLVLQKSLGSRPALRVQAKKKNALVSEGIIAHPVHLVPNFIRHLVAHAVIARKVKKGMSKPSMKELNSFHWPFNFFDPVPPASLDHVPDRDHELRAQLVELGHRFGEDPCPRSTRTVGNNGELKIRGIVQKLLAVQGFFSVVTECLKNESSEKPMKPAKRQPVSTRLAWQRYSSPLSKPKLPRLSKR